MTNHKLKIPEAPRSIQKGVPLKYLIDKEAVRCLALNISHIKNDFEIDGFCDFALKDIEPLSLMQRGSHVAKALKKFLPENYSESISILMDSLTPEDKLAEEFGLAVFFYLPHSCFISEYGLDKKYNDSEDPFDVSMDAMYELTKRFTSEFAIRNFLIEQPERTLQHLSNWLDDSNPHIRRLCSEGTRPKLPWGKRIQPFVKDPLPTKFILEKLKNDPSLYVRRSVANHLGDVAKDHPDYVFSICEEWLDSGASSDLKWLIRHAVRYYAKKQDARAIEIRKLAK